MNEFREGLVNRIENYDRWIQNAEENKEWASRAIFLELRNVVQSILREYDKGYSGEV